MRQQGLLGGAERLGDPVQRGHARAGQPALQLAEEGVRKACAARELDKGEAALLA